MKPKPYPSLVCINCGLRFGRGIPVPNFVTWQKGECGVCGRWMSVTEPRHFGHLALDEEKK